MAHSLSAKKRSRQNLKRRQRNQMIRSRIKTQLKKIRALLGSDKKDKAVLQTELKNSYSLLDTAVSKRVIHKNKSARLKSRLTVAVNK
ncbi:MAG: 30S ribosomal protein S20 [Planctomycetes bacterium]|nr:30S ribosomal protein S20 [Planctomycetota bacterium]